MTLIGGRPPDEPLMSSPPDPTRRKSSNTLKRLSSASKKHRRRISETWKSVTGAQQAPPPTPPPLPASAGLAAPPPNPRSLSHTGSPHHHPLPVTTESPPPMRPLRRNSLGDLRVPSTVLAAQRGFRQGSEVLRQFAAGVEGESSNSAWGIREADIGTELRLLLAKRDALAADRRTAAVLSRQASTWSLARTLVDLGVGGGDEARTSSELRRERRITLQESLSSPAGQGGWAAAGSVGRTGGDADKLAQLRDVLQPSKSFSSRRQPSRSGLSSFLVTWRGKPPPPPVATPEASLRITSSRTSSRPSLSSIFRKASSSFDRERESPKSRSSLATERSAESARSSPIEAPPTLLLTPGNLPDLLQRLRAATADCQRCLDELER